MLIDPNPQTRGTASAQTPPSTQASLSPELAKLVADLKLSLGQSLEALVTRVQVVTEAERQTLLSLQPAAPKNQAERQMQSLLQEPALKLVELKIQQSLVPTLTALPLVKAQTLQVLLTPRGLMLVPQVQTAPATSAPAQNSTQLPVNATVTTPAGGPPAQPGAPPSIPPAPNAKATPAQPTTQTANPAATAPALNPTVVRQTAAVGAAQNPDIAAGQAPPKLPASEFGAPSSAAPAAKPGAPAAQVANPTHNTAPLNPAPASRIRPLIAETLARTLPQAQELPPLLRALGELNRQLLSVPRTSLPPQVQQLQSLLNKLPALSLNLSQLNPSQPAPLRQTLERSGVFYEHRLLQASTEAGADQSLRKLPEQDLKGLLIQIQQWSNTPAPPAPPASRAPVPDALSQLLFGLVQVFLPRQKPHRNAGALEQLKSALQQQVGQSLARIQTQQMRTLNNQLLDPDAPQQVHMDIPLRLPEGYGNLYLHLFEPRLPPEADREPGKKEPRRQNKGRWRVFMELMLDELGGLAAEVSVLEQDLEITLWTEGETLRERASAHLRELRSDLEHQGLVVRELQCSQHPPPAQKVQLDYALIDIKT